METKTLNLEEKIALHRRMALGYRDAYHKEKSKDSVTYDGWKFSKDAVYSSPYFTGDKSYPMGEFSIDTVKGATNETQAYLLTFPDWSQTDFKFWASENGFVISVHSQ